MTARSEVRTDAFHAHLDACRQCREHPFQLCAVGGRLLREAATGTGEDREGQILIEQHLAESRVLADGILSSWLRGSATYVHARRSLVALGYMPDEADAVLAAAKVKS